MEQDDFFRVGSGGVWNGNALADLEEAAAAAHPVEEIEPEEPADPDQARADADRAEILTFIFQHVFGDGGRPGPLARRLNTAFRKFTVLVWQVDCSLVDGVSLAALAEIAGCSRALLSQYAIENSDRLGLRGRGQKRLEAREKYRDMASENWDRRREKNGGNAYRSGAKPRGKPEPSRPCRKGPRKAGDGGDPKTVLLQAQEAAEASRCAAIRSEAAALRSEEAAARAEGVERRLRQPPN